MIRVPSIEEILTGSSRETEEWLDDELIPRRATRFRDFRDRLGKVIFRDDWSGEECAGWFAGSFGRVHRSEAERDADLEWRRAFNAKERELAALRIFDPLTPEHIAEIDLKVEPWKKKAQAVKRRREAVESMLQRIFSEGTLGAFYISQDDGQEVNIACDEWGLKRRRSGNFHSDKVHLHETGVFHVDVSGERRGFTIYIDTKESEAVLTTYFQGEPKEAASQPAPEVGAVVQATMGADPTQEDGPPKRRSMSTEDEAILLNRFDSVLAAARRKWPKGKNYPGHILAARDLVGESKHFQGFKKGTLRQILNGTYRPMKKRNITGIHW